MSIYVQGRYEIQVLDSFGLKGGHNECGSIYAQKGTAVNMCYPPLQWQTYDIEFKAARFEADGKKTAPAIITLWHNGVLLHDRFELKGPSPSRPVFHETPPQGPLFLQHLSGDVQYRNIWVVENK